jgi:hypothetical protein
MIEISEQTRSRIHAVFPEQHSEVEAYLQVECGDDLPGIHPHYSELAQRIRFAVLKLSDGQFGKLKQEVGEAAIDWRDVLMAAGFGEDTQAHLAWQPQESR